MRTPALSGEKIGYCTGCIALLHLPMCTRACWWGLVGLLLFQHLLTSRAQQEDAAEVALQALTGAPGSPQQQQQQWSGRQGVRAMGM